MRRTLVGSSLAAVSVLGLTALAPPADAASTVTVYGPISCATLSSPPPIPTAYAYRAVRARFQAANGEANDATLTQDGFWFSVTFTQVPAGGESVNVYVSCNRIPDWGTSFAMQSSGSQFLSLFWH
jgi:hypothetical protein